MAVQSATPANVEADAIIRINNSLLPVDESIEVGGRTIAVRFGPDEGGPALPPNIASIRSGASSPRRPPYAPAPD